MERAQSSVGKFMTSEHGLMLEALLAMGLAYYFWSFEVMVIAALAFTIANVVKIKMYLEKNA